MNQFSGVVTDDTWFRHTTLQCKLRRYYIKKRAYKYSSTPFLASNQDLCCYSEEQYEGIAAVIKNLSWEPFNVTFNGGTICNYGILQFVMDYNICYRCYYWLLFLPWTGGDGVASFTSIVVRMDPESEQKLLAFVETIERAIVASGM